MTRTGHDFENGANGATLTAALAGSTSVAVSGAGHTQVIATDRSMHGTRSAKLVSPAGAVSGTNYISQTIPATDVVAFREYFQVDAAPIGADAVILWLGIGSAQGWSMELTTTGALRGRSDANDAKWTTAPNPVVNTSPGTLAPDTWYRLEVGLARDASAGTMNIAIYPGDSSVPVAQFNPGVQTGINTGSGAYTNLRFGPKASTGTSELTMWVDDWMVDDATTTFIGPATVALATPVLTFVSKTDPTVFGAADGTYTASWPAVSGAVRYEAAVAPGDVTTGYTVVADDVTSPYTWTGLTGGQKTFAIRAKGA